MGWMTETLASLAPHEQLAVARAFSVYFQLVNIAEQIHRVRRRRDYQRDAEAFAEIVTRHAGMVFATCNRILGDRAAAEEVAQECFLALA
ncbi:MAG: hypothetical protein IIB55_01640, partial [Planctomycetes bacterium]|nr:hypothetical protein [Planctomycetota bacterium]